VEPSGLVGITGGKLTTFRLAARQVLREAARQHPKLAPARGGSLFAPAGTNERRISGRLGGDAARWIASLPAAQQASIAGTPYRWGELLWSLRHEHVVRLDDLLLRRTRLGLVAPHGAIALLPDLEPICRAELHWDAPRLWFEVRKALSLLDGVELTGIGVDAWGVDYALLGEGGELGKVFTR